MLRPFLFCLLLMVMSGPVAAIAYVVLALMGY